MSEELPKTQHVNDLIELLRSGDAKSLKQLRNVLAIDSNELANQIGVSTQTLELWEKGEEQPLSLNHARWKIRLSSYVDDKISAFLGTNDIEVTSKYWALVWDFVS